LTNGADRGQIVVLIVEDEALVRMFTADVLREDGGFKIVEAVNADEALTILEATADVQVVVTDVEMPGRMDGFALSRTVSQAWPNIGIIVTSGRSAPGPGDLPDGALYFAKPYSPEALIRAAATIAGSGRTELQTRRAAALGRTAPVHPTSKFDGARAKSGLQRGLAQPLAEPDE
jgi:CheY-like chemotaxis protein